MKSTKGNPEGTSDSPTKDLPEFYDRTRQVGGEDAEAVARAAVAWVKRCEGGQSVFGKRGRVRGPLYLAVPDRDGQAVRFLAVDTDGGISVNYNHMDGHTPYGNVKERLRLNQLLNEIDDISIDDKYADPPSWPKVGLDVLRDEATRSAFFRVFDSVAARLSGHQPPAAR